MESKPPAASLTRKDQHVLHGFFTQLGGEKDVRCFKIIYMSYRQRHGRLVLGGPAVDKAPV